MMRLLLLVLLFAEMLNAAPPTSPPPTEVKSPLAGAVISSDGYKKIRENISQLQKNIDGTQLNLEVSQKNLSTIADEIKELDKLEQDYLELRKKHQAYLTNAASEVAKNGKAMDRLEKVDKETRGIASAEETSRQLALEIIERERADRNRWKEDSQQKTTRVQTLLKDVQKNLNEISARKKSLYEELQSWKRKEYEYQKLLAEFNFQKQEFERMAKQ